MKLTGYDLYDRPKRKPISLMQTEVFEGVTGLPRELKRDL
jgi:hypothetical protein